MKLCGSSTISSKIPPLPGGSAAFLLVLAISALGGCSAGSAPRQPRVSAQLTAEPSKPPAAPDHGSAALRSGRAALVWLQPGSALNVLSGEDQSGAEPETHSTSGCRSSQPLGASLAELARNAHHTEEANFEQTDFSDTFLDWLFGGGLGRTALNVGTVVVFPPYALYMLGNAGIALAGYDPLYITDALPEAARTPALSAYDELTSVPGRLNAAVLRQDFCSPQKPAAALPAAYDQSNQPDGDRN